jgi:hypothetical protein
LYSTFGLNPKFISNSQGPTLGEIRSTFHTAADDSFTHFNKILTEYPQASKLINTRYRGTQKLVPTKMFSVEDVFNTPDSRHTYKLFADPETGKTKVGLDIFADKNMSYAGTRAGSELALFNFLKSSRPEAMYFPRELGYLFKDDNAISNMSRLMSLKRQYGINKPFSALTDSELDNIITGGLNTKMFSLRKIGGFTES